MSIKPGELHSVLGVREDGTPPSTPTGLSGEYVQQGETSQIELVWDRNPSEDEVIRYDLLRAEGAAGSFSHYSYVSEPSSGDYVYFIDSHLDEEVEEYRYRVKAENAAGWGFACAPVTIGTEGGPQGAPQSKILKGMPEKLVLDANFPNPFNPTTQFRFGISRASHARLRILNTRGQLVRTLVDEDHVPGWYTVTWDGRNSGGREVASGIYLYVLEAEGKRLLRRMTLIR